MTRSPEVFSAAADRIARLESQISVLIKQSRTSEELVQAHETQLQSLAARVSILERPSGLRGESVQKSPADSLRRGSGSLPRVDSPLSPKLNAELRELKDSAIEPTFCTNHPTIVHRTPRPVVERLSCEDSDFVLCSNRRQKARASTQRRGEDPPGTKRCPFCRVLVTKVGTSNRISCSCGNHWCWACEHGYWGEGSVYHHMIEGHGGCYTDT
jgi:hypothetical protein